MSPAAPKPEIVRSEEYRAHIRGLPCCCGCERPGDPHHVLHKRGFGDARNIVPLARECHDEGGNMGWKTWEKRRGVKLKPIAVILYEAWLKLRDGEQGYE